MTAKIDLTFVTRFVSLILNAVILKAQAGGDKPHPYSLSNAFFV